MNLIPVPPQIPSREWLQAVAVELMRLKPGLRHENAMRCAELAHGGTWLLDPTEAAQWWLLAITAAARNLPRLPRGLLG